LKNVKVSQADLSQPVGHLPQTDVILSLNAAIMPGHDLRLNFLRGMASRLKPGGHLLLDLPSIESLLYGTFREIEWHRRAGVPAKKAERMADVSCISRPRLLARGIFYRGGEPTKHYLREELLVLVRDELNLALIDILKMEYDWETEMEDESIPAWMGEPYPWDWLVIAKAI
jgi:SAM-dependent methyltransferase